MAIAFVCLVVVLWALFKLLGVYTHHGETAEVPDFKGKSMAELDNFVKDKNVGFIIIDSVYSPDEKPGIVIKHTLFPYTTLFRYRKSVV